MIRHAFLAATAMFVWSAPTHAASPFNGTWKTDIAASKFSDKPDEYLLKDGTYWCKSCVPPVKIPADGAMHAVTGHDYYDMAQMKVDGPNAVTLTLQNGGKTVGTNHLEVSADGKTLTSSSNRINPATGTAASGRSTATRVGAMPAGAHPLSGSWKLASVDAISDTGDSQTLMVDGDTLTLSTPTGEGYTAMFGGPAVTQRNDPAKTMVSLKKLSDNRIVETDMRDGKVVQTFDMTVSPDGRTMTMVVSDKRAGTIDTVTLTKQ